MNYPWKKPKETPIESPVAQEEAAPVKTSESATPVSDRESFEQALQEYAKACEAVKAKKAAMYRRFLELNESRNNGTKDQMELPRNNPFDLEQAWTAAQETGSPEKMKEWVAVVNGLSSSVLRDDAFREAVETTAAAVKPYAIQREKQLEAEVKELSAKVSKARKAFEDFRREITEKLVKPYIEADNFLKNDIPSLFIGSCDGDHLGISTVPQFSVETQLNGILCEAENANRPLLKGNPYKHLTEHRGIYDIPDGWVGMTPHGIVGGRRPSVAGASGTVERIFPKNITK